MITKEECKRALDCAVERGKVQPSKTTIKEWIKAISAEVDELSKAFKSPSTHIPLFTEVEEELADVVITCMSMAANYGIDLGKVIEAKMKYNEIRED